MIGPRGGLAAGILQGQQIFQNFHNQFQQGKQQRQLEEIANEEPQESTGFTADQGKELERLAKQGYAIDFDQAKNVYVARNDAGDTKTVAMQGVTDFMGERTAGAFPREQQDNTRMLAMADVIGRSDPARGIQMRQQVQQGIFTAKKQAREEKQWAREDSIEAIDQESGRALKASMIDGEGNPIPATPDIYLSNIQQRAGRLAQAGHSKQAEEALHQFFGLAEAKIRLDAKSREKEAAPAMAAFQAGNTQALVDYYNKYVPGATKITSIERGQDGSYTINATGLDGKAAPARQVDQRGMLAMAQSLNDPGALLQHAWNEANFGLRLRGEARADNADRRADRADGRAAAAHGLAMADRGERLADKREARDVREALARESSPEMTPTQLRAVRAGIIQTPGADSPKAKFDYDPEKVQKAFGETTTDPLTGKDTVKRNPAEERKFQEFMADNPSIRDVDEGLVKFNRARIQSERASRPAPPDAAVQYLRANPTMAAEFDKKYGKGASASVLK